MSSYSNTTSTEADIQRVQDYLEHHVSQKRRRHIYAVADTAEGLAGRLGLDPHRARLGGLLHDLAREWDQDSMKETALRDGLGLSDLEAKNPTLLHGRAAAQYAREQWNVDDDELLAAVRHHTLGTADPGDMDLVLYCADYLEPNRRFLDDELRQMRESGDLEATAAAIVDHIRGRGFSLAPETLAMERALRRRMVSG